MLYVFLVNNGTTLTFDLNLAMDTVENLKLAIHGLSSIPPDQQVLLVSGGERLNSTDKVYNNKCTAGTDTCPIFLFSKMNVGYTIEYNVDGEEYQDRVTGCLNMEPNFNTVQARTEMAGELYEEDHKIYSVCEKLVHDQHLQQQGWAAVLANFEDLISTFRKNGNAALKLCEDILKNKETYFQLIRSYEDDKKLMARIPILKCLTEKSQSLNMFDWIMQSDNKGNRDLDDRFCIEHLNIFDEAKMEAMREAVESTLKTCGNTKKTEIKGLESRLSMLGTKMNEVRKLFEKQEILSKGFTQNKSRLSDINDPSILPDLCQNHREQLENMLENHLELIDLLDAIQRCKQELSTVLFERLFWIIGVQEMLNAEAKKIVADGIRLHKLRHSLEIMQNLHIAPKIYLKSISEIYRRRQFYEQYSCWAKNVCQTSKEVLDKEIQTRETFNLEFEKHIFKVLFMTLFRGMDELPSRQAIEDVETTAASIESDQSLPAITADDIEYLKAELPDLSELLVYDDMSASTLVLPSVPQTTTTTSTEPPTEENVRKDSKTDVSTDTSTLGQQVDELLVMQKEMEETVREKERLIDNLNEKLVDREEQIVHCSDRLQNSINVNVRLFDMIKNIKAELQEQVKQQVHCYKDELKEVIETITKLCHEEETSKQQAIGLLETKLVDIIQTLGKEQTRMAELQQEFDDEVSQLEVLTNQVNESKLKFVYVDQLLTEMSNILNSLEAAGSEQQQQLTSYKTRFEDFKQNIKSNNEHIRVQLNNFQNYQLELFRSEFEELIESQQQKYQQKIEQLQNDTQKTKEEELQELKEKLQMEHRMEMDSLRHRYKLAITTTSIERTSSETSLEKVQLDIVDQSAQEKEIQRLNTQIVEQKSEFEEKIEKLTADYEQKLESLRSESMAVSGMSYEQHNNIIIKSRLNAFEEMYNRVSSKLSAVDVDVDDGQKCKEALATIKQDIADINREFEALNSRSILVLPNNPQMPAMTHSASFTGNESLTDDGMFTYLNFDVGAKVLVYYDSRYQNYLAFTLTEALYFVHFPGAKDPEFFPDPPTENHCVRVEVLTRDYCQIKKKLNRYRLPLDTQFFRLVVKPLSRVESGIKPIKQVIMKNHTTLNSRNLNVQVLLSLINSPNSSGANDNNKLPLSQSCYDFKPQS